MIWNYCTGDYLLYNLAYLELEPVFECLSEDSEGEISFKRCSAKDYCQATDSRVNYDYDESLRNWMTDLNLACKYLTVKFTHRSFLTTCLINEFNM